MDAPAEEFLKRNKSCVRNSWFFLEMGIDRLFLVASSSCAFYKSLVRSYLYIHINTLDCCVVAVLTSG